jgi:hypothetical protein
MPVPVIWPRRGWRRRTFDEVEQLISDWSPELQLRWWKEESRAYRALLQKQLTRQDAARQPRPQPHHKLVEAVILQKPQIAYSAFWPTAKQIFDSRPKDFAGISDVSVEERRVTVTSHGRTKPWPNSKNALRQLIKRTLRRLRR